MQQQGKARVRYARWSVGLGLGLAIAMAAPTTLRAPLNRDGCQPPLGVAVKRVCCVHRAPPMATLLTCGCLQSVRHWTATRVQCGWSPRGSTEAPKPTLGRALVTPPPKGDVE